jgi:hypothetical protein
MNTTDHPRLLARIAGGFYLIITACALFAYVYVRGRVIIPSDMPQTAANVLAHEQLYRSGFAAAIIVVVCNPPLGLILYELLKVVNPRLALMALVFITVSTTIEAVNLLNYISPLFTFTLPEYANAFNDAQRQALARGPIRTWAYVFDVSLTFFGVFCALVGSLIVRSKFLPAFLGVLMIAAGVRYWVDNFVLFLGLPEVPLLNVVPVTLIAEVGLALWLLIVGVDETKWRAKAAGLTAAS